MISTSIALLLTSALQVEAIAVNAYLGINDKYNYRGVAVSDGGPTPNVGVSANLESGWFFDAWGARTDVKQYRGDGYSRRPEWDLSIGRVETVNLNWRWAISHARIMRHHETLYAGRDYVEWRGNLFYQNVLGIQLAYSPDYRNTGWHSLVSEVDFRWPLSPRVDLQLGLGETEGLAGYEVRYSYGWAGFAYNMEKIHWQLRWHESGSNADRVLGSARAGGHLELNVTMAWQWEI